MDFVVVSLFKLLCVQVLCIKVFEMGNIYMDMSSAELCFVLFCFALLCFAFNGFHSMSKRSCSPKFQHPHESVGGVVMKATLKP
jgi:hypothetical protein